MNQNGPPRRTLPKQKPYVPEYVRWNKQPILMDRSGRVVEPQSDSAQRVVHLPPEHKNPREQTRKGVSQRLREENMPPQNAVPYSTGGVEQLWTMNGEPIPEEDNVTIDANEYVVPKQSIGSMDVGLHDERAVAETNDDSSPAYEDGSQDDVVDDLPKDTSQGQSSDFVNPGGHLLLIHGKIVARGSIELINEVITDIVYDRHPDIKGSTLDPDDFVVLKRMKVNFGVSIE